MCLDSAGGAPRVRRIPESGPNRPAQPLGAGWIGLWGLTTIVRRSAESRGLRSGVGPPVLRLSGFMSAARAPRSRPSPVSLVLALALPALATTAGLSGCVCPPSLDEWSEVGFRTPEETLRSFQLAVRADAPRVEYRCLSTNLRRGLPQIAWREAREEWYAENPFLRHGIAKATIEDSERLSDQRHRFVVESYGNRFVIELVREDFYQVYVEGELIADELLPYDRREEFLDQFDDFVSASPPEQGRRFVSGGVTVPAGDFPTPSISELRIGQEWKVDAMGPADESSSPTGPEPTSEPTEPTP